MSKANRVTRLTSAACEQIQARMLEACRKIASDHGLVTADNVAMLLKAQVKT